MHGMPPGVIYPPMPGRYPPLGQVGMPGPHGVGMPPQDHGDDMDNGLDSSMSKRAVNTFPPEPVSRERAAACHHG
eukprot:3821435-Rhodomonas_salina.3